MTGMGRIDKRCEFSSQRLDLFVIQDADTGEVSVFSVKLDLLVAQSIRLPILSGDRFWRQSTDGSVITRQVVDHQPLFARILRVITTLSRMALSAAPA